jgi:hypothetical protein
LIQLSTDSAVQALGDNHFNLIRRGADGSLKLSADHWRLSAVTDETLRFSAREEDAPPLELNVQDIERVVWDRLPKQTVRSQVRFHLKRGDVWTFSGNVNESALS